MLKDHACMSTPTLADSVGGRRLWAAFLTLLLLVGARVGRVGAYYPMDSGEKVYANRINEQDPELGRRRQNVGLLDIMITNLGIVGNPGYVPQESSASWRGGEYLYAASMWIGAVASDNLAYVSTGAYETELRPSLAPVDHIYSSFEGALKGNRQGFSTEPDDDRDGNIDEDPVNGKDDDGDGRTDEDFAAISQQMFSCEYWDYTEEARARWTEHRPLNVRIHQESYAWSTEGANEFIGLDFKIVNDGFETLRQVYLGFFVDSDVGPKANPDFYSDDRGAFYARDTTFTNPAVSFKCNQRLPPNDLMDCANQTLSLNICYMYDVPDDGAGATGGDVDGYFGGMFLGHTTDPSGERAPAEVKVHTARFFNGGNPYPAGDPANDTQRYDLLQSGTKPTRPTGAPDDYRYCFSAGPFSEMAAGEVLQLQMAFVVGSGLNGMLTNAVNAQTIYNGQWRNADGDPLTGMNGEETCLRALVAGEPLIYKDPCDSLTPTVRTIKETYCIADNYVDHDCDCCTPLFPDNAAATNGPGLEALIHWVGPVAPPAPATNIDTRDTSWVAAGDRAVEIAWDNQAELIADPVQKKILFTGYKIWRVEGWNRPVGSPGPAPTDWQLIASLSLEPEDSLGVDSPYYLLKTTEPRFVHTTADSSGPVPTGSSDTTEAFKWRYPVGRYSYRDTMGLKNGMIYFYDVTAFATWWDSRTGKRILLEGSPTAMERDAVYPRWKANPAGDLGGIYVVPNPYILGKNPDGWDLTPSKVDPTGTKLAFVGLPSEACTVKIYTLAGDLVRTLEHPGTGAGRTQGDVYWDLISRNGQDIVAGIYIYLVECGGKSKVGRFVVVR
jgi:hypothetical protein